MKKTLIFLLIFIDNFCFAQITFQKKYSSGYGSSVVQTSDSGYIVVGMIYTIDPANLMDICLIKTDQLGDTLWTRTYDFSPNESANSVKQTYDGGYIIVGETDSRQFVIRADANGDSLWTKIFDSSWGSLVTSVQQTSDSGFVVSGAMRFLNPQVLDFSLVRMDKSGSVLWKRIYGHSDDEVANCVIETTDKGFIMVGTSKRDQPSTSYSYIVKTDSVGDTLWTRNIYNNGYGGAGSVVQVSNGNYVVGGTTLDTLQNSDHIYLCELDVLGNVVWTKLFGDSMGLDFRSLKSTADGGFIITGLCRRLQSEDIYLLKTNATGDSIWTRSFGGNNFDFSFDVMQTFDGGYIISGTTQSFDTSSSYTYLIKTDSLGHSGCYENIPNTFVLPYNIQFTNVQTIVMLNATPVISLNAIMGSGISVYDLCNPGTGINKINSTMQTRVFPNPSTGQFNIQFEKNSAGAESQRIEFYNLVNELVYSQQIQIHSGLNEITGDISFLPEGIYFIHIAGIPEFRTTIIKQ